MGDKFIWIDKEQAKKYGSYLTASGKGSLFYSNLQIHNEMSMLGYIHYIEGSGWMGAARNPIYYLLYKSKNYNTRRGIKDITTAQTWVEKRVKIYDYFDLYNIWTKINNTNIDRDNIKIVCFYYFHEIAMFLYKAGERTLCFCGMHNYINHGNNTFSE